VRRTLMLRHIAVSATVLLFSHLAPAQSATMAYTVSMPDPASHVFHMHLRCDGLTGELHDFKLPMWTPGYYRLIDYWKNVSHFRVEDGRGRALPFEKVAPNTWRVAAGGAASIALSYDVFGNTHFAAQNSLTGERAF